jgi:hypothetical protein
VLAPTTTTTLDAVPSPPEAAGAVFELAVLELCIRSFLASFEYGRLPWFGSNGNWPTLGQRDQPWLAQIEAF